MVKGRAAFVLPDARAGHRKAGRKVRAQLVRCAQSGHSVSDSNFHELYCTTLFAAFCFWFDQERDVLYYFVCYFLLLVQSRGNKLWMATIPHKRKLWAARRLRGARGQTCKHSRRGKQERSRRMAAWEAHGPLPFLMLKITALYMEQQPAN